VACGQIKNIPCGQGKHIGFNPQVNQKLGQDSWLATRRRKRLEYRGITRDYKKRKEVCQSMIRV